MKKFATLAMALVMIVCALALPVSAVTANGTLGEVPLYKGAITLDGKKDEAYSLGLKLTTKVQDTNKGESTADVTLLHDGKNVYVLVEGKSAYPLGEYNPKYDGTKSWNTTCIELFFDWSDRAAAAADAYKYYGRLDGAIDGVYKAAGVAAEHIQMKVTVNKDAKTFVMEFVAPMRDGAATGSNVGFHVIYDSDKTMAKDKNATRTTSAITPNAGNAAEKFPSLILSNKEVKLAASTTAATTKAPSTKPTSPATFDAGIVLAVVAAAAGAGVVVSKKRH